MSARTLHVTAIVAVAVLGTMLHGQARAQEMEENALKAKFVEGFIRYVTWPQDGGADPGAPFVVCIIGTDGIKDHLRRVTVDAPDSTRKRTQFRYLRRAPDAAACHVLFIAASERDRLRLILSQVEGRPVLTVSDSSGFGEGGVMINLYRDGEYMRFEANQRAVEASGLKFSSQMLRLARLIGSE